MSTLRNITFDCTDPATVAGFWAAVLDREVDPGDNLYMRSIGYPALGTDPAASAGPIWLFLAVPEPKTAKNRMYLDLACADRAAEVARLVALGATHVRDVAEWGLEWSVMADPEGNEFCLSAAH
ncbi:MAG: VOC family protein [Austwickia sp.]|nr:VOC family protein [Actinomycetota bacterium]MCB1253917.1 VOC family protein [Austwickia sp.]MCO5310735.1 VOC family protein [Austwickia sp.]